MLYQQCTISTHPETDFDKLTIKELKKKIDIENCETLIVVPLNKTQAEPQKLGELMFKDKYTEKGFVELHGRRFMFVAIYKWSEIGRV